MPASEACPAGVPAGSAARTPIVACPLLSSPVFLEISLMPAFLPARPLDGIRILALVGEEYEDLELWYPKLRLEEAGAHVTVAGSMQGRTFSGKHGYPSTSDAAISDMEAADFHGILLPGGWMPDKLRRDEKVLDLVREFAAHGKLVAAICHGGWIPISAGVYRGVRVTGSPGIKDDLMNAGAIWEDTQVVVDRHFVSSRKPADLPAFMAAIVELLAAVPVP
jgi:protease I